MSDAHRIVAVIPLAWGEEAMLATLGAALQVSASAGCGFDVLLLGGSAQPPSLQWESMAGAKTVQLVAHEALGDAQNLPAMATATGQTLREQAGQRVLLVPPGADGEELAGHLAAQLGAQLLGRCNQLRWDGAGWLAERAGWGGRKTLELRLAAPLGVACLRLGKAQAVAGAVTVEPQVMALQHSLPPAMAIEQSQSEQRLAPVQGARLVVSGGRGVNEQGFALLEELASRLDAALGGSLPAVDAGLVPVARQVGISGNFVSADIYLAVGISGTPQHLAGIGSETCILAVNKDPAADIFKVANVGVVAEWEELLPALLEQLPA
ncbi:electron transfer flavoprotein subunit alpha/FixB family protein [Pseudomonas sp. MYb185]|uniref:electron transfer flavoprotein subunit alpha/FixB family protein n=1 Tax=Pseudomonas sp. MYb185 TaxID=1848729 RepID=UPI000CFB5FE9|nr:electron transfer flavoprotein subunit alpha/FixB family protein [Pseudomonas sp. MYb185]PRB81395.1 electron transfer flavoprotein subunit alpha [Pseudomonas sp. MYb185]